MVRRLLASQLELWQYKTILFGVFAVHGDQAGSEFKPGVDSMGQSRQLAEELTQSAEQQAAASERAVETLVNSPKVYCAVDYWSSTGPEHGSGIKVDKGNRPPDDSTLGVLASPFSPQLAQVEQALNSQIPESWHHGKGSVGVIDTPNQTAVVARFQSPHTENNGRPDVTFLAISPNGPEFDAVKRGVESDPALLLEALRRLLPDETRTIPDDVSLGDQVTKFTDAILQRQW